MRFAAELNQSHLGELCMIEAALGLFHKAERLQGNAEKYHECNTSV